MSSIACIRGSSRGFSGIRRDRAAGLTCLREHPLRPAIRTVPVGIAGLLSGPRETVVQCVPADTVLHAARGQATLPTSFVRDDCSPPRPAQGPDRAARYRLRARGLHCSASALPRDVPPVDYHHRNSTVAIYSVPGNCPAATGNGNASSPQLVEQDVARRRRPGPKPTRRPSCGCNYRSATLTTPTTGRRAQDRLSRFSLPLPKPWRGSARGDVD